MDELKLNIAKYMKLDEELTKRNNVVKELRSKKNDIQKKILTFIELNNLKNTKINLNHCYIKYNINESLCPINMDFLDTCFNNYFNDSKKADDIIEFIERQRQLNKKKTIGLKKLKNKSKKHKSFKP